MVRAAFAVLSLAGVVAGVAVAGTVGTACAPVDARIPGVLDLRSDGRGAALDKRSPKEETNTRDGFDALLGGRGGIVGPKGRVGAEERGGFCLRIVPLGGERDLVGDLAPIMKDRALRDVTITDGQTCGECAFGGCTFLVPGLDLVTIALLPTSTLSLEGVRVVPDESAAPTTPAPPATRDTPPPDAAAEPEPEGGYER